MMTLTKQTLWLAEDRKDFLDLIKIDYINQMIAYLNHDHKKQCTLLSLMQVTSYYTCKHLSDVEKTDAVYVECEL
jgi:hypothetical protein